MSPFIPAVERIARARVLIQQARDLPIPEGNNRFEFSYVAQVKALLQQARDMVKFIPRTPSASAELKAEVNRVLQEADQANKDLFH